MKKFLTAGLAVALIASVLAVAGCGGDTDQAREYMQAADSAYATARVEMEELQNSLTTVLGGAVSGNFSALTPEVVQQAEDGLASVLRQLPGVKTQYEQITSLDGVDDYVEYANAMIKTIDSDMKVLGEGQKLVQAIAPMIQAGDTAAVTQFFQENAADISRIQEDSMAASRNYDEAQAIKKDNNLGE